MTLFGEVRVNIVDAEKPVPPSREWTAPAAIKEEFILGTEA